MLSPEITTQALGNSRGRSRAVVMVGTIRTLNLTFFGRYRGRAQDLGDSSHLVGDYRST